MLRYAQLFKLITVLHLNQTCTTHCDHYSNTVKAYILKVVIISTIIWRRCSL